MPPLATLPVDTSLLPLKVSGMAVEVGNPTADGIREKELRVTWPPLSDSTIGEAKCISVAMKQPGADYEAMSVLTLFPTATTFTHRPFGDAGQYCYRFVILAEAARSEFTEVCAEFPAQAPPGPVRYLPRNARRAGYTLRRRAVRWQRVVPSSVDFWHLADGGHGGSSWPSGDQACDAAQQVVVGVSKGLRLPGADSFATNNPYVWAGAAASPYGIVRVRLKWRSYRRGNRFALTKKNRT